MDHKKEGSKLYNMLFSKIPFKRRMKINVCLVFCPGYLKKRLVYLNVMGLLLAISSIINCLFLNIPGSGYPDKKKIRSIFSAFFSSKGIRLVKNFENKITVFIYLISPV
jgi:hypothetical protein